MEIHMAEPSSTALAVAAPTALGITAASLVPGVDLNAVIGGVAGALFFVAWARDLTVWARLAYLFVSWIGGYQVAVEVVGRGYSTYSGLPALISGALIVAALISVADWVRGGQPPAWLRAVMSWVRPGSGGNGNG
ncbi:putative holin [Metapseudomonas otitidis]|uniref:putative holin n=2 Tax=Metapseudomonas otitidis TaxID=319939 RepID=UPI001F118D17|nr:putative holin [Pseudomonas otitidis]